MVRACRHTCVPASLRLPRFQLAAVAARAHAARAGPRHSAPPCPPPQPALRSPPNSSDTGGLCACNSGFFSASGGLPCTACAEGSTSTEFGSTSCGCNAPLFSEWLPNNTCACPPGRTLEAGACLLLPGGACAAGAECAAPSLCADGVCVAACPEGSAAAAGGCVCNATANYFSDTGSAPCRLCGGGAVANGAGTGCTCNAPAAYNATLNVCMCPPGQTYVNGTCLQNIGGACSSDVDCVSSTCSSGNCTSTCPSDSSNIGVVGCECACARMRRGTAAAPASAAPPLLPDGAAGVAAGAAAWVTAATLSHALPSPLLPPPLPSQPQATRTFSTPHLARRLALHAPSAPTPSALAPGAVCALCLSAQSGRPTTHGGCRHDFAVLWTWRAVPPTPRNMRPPRPQPNLAHPMCTRLPLPRAARARRARRRPAARAAGFRGSRVPTATTACRPCAARARA